MINSCSIWLCQWGSVGHKDVVACSQDTELPQGSCSAASKTEPQYLRRELPREFSSVLQKNHLGTPTPKECVLMPCDVLLRLSQRLNDLSITRLPTQEDVTGSPGRNGGDLPSIEHASLSVEKVWIQTWCLGALAAEQMSDPCLAPCCGTQPLLSWWATCTGMYVGKHTVKALK